MLTAAGKAKREDYNLFTIYTAALANYTPLKNLPPAIHIQEHLINRKSWVTGNSGQKKETLWQKITHFCRRVQEMKLCHFCGERFKYAKSLKYTPLGPQSINPILDRYILKRQTLSCISNG